ncbi:MAG: DEAD/DEAH box helicase [Bacteroidetes bacterium]|nr:MAG: DEAD/DEAH box helicase [Bacteroidota bacterium]
MSYEKILSRFKINALNEMQNATISAIQKRADVVLISPTGSGKTIAFLLPLLNLLSKNEKEVQTMILVPTRELAIQIEQVFKMLGTEFKINCCYGGHSVSIEKNNLQQPPAVLVGTPGRIAHHIDHQNISTNKISLLILDEFDKSLDAGFQDEMSFIISMMSFLKQRILTSATPLKEIPSFVGLHKAIELNFSHSHKKTESALKIKIVTATGIDKMDALMLLIGKLGNKSKIVFCNHRDTVERISGHLKQLKIEHGVYHGGLDQIDREKALIKLKNGSIHLLLSTDLASRGLDIPEIEFIIHYQLPATEDIMIHRNGRTARMYASGTAYFLLKETDHLPPFLKITTENESLPEKMQSPKPSEWKTLYLSAGKKDKINKIDIVGMLLQKGGLKKEELGKIEVLDYSAYAAVKREKIEQTLDMIRNEKIKNKKVKFEISI